MSDFFMGDRQTVVISTPYGQVRLPRDKNLSYERACEMARRKVEARRREARFKVNAEEHFRELIDDRGISTRVRQYCDGESVYQTREQVRFPTGESVRQDWSIDFVQVVTKNTRTGVTCRRNVRSGETFAELGDYWKRSALIGADGVAISADAVIYDQAIALAKREAGALTEG